MAKNILLVEDEEFIRQMYQTALTGQGYSVETASNGEEAIAKLEAATNSYDLLILDIMLPKVDGLTVLKKVKEANSPHKTVPVFLLTNLGLDNIIKQAMELGAEKYFIKSNFLPKDIVNEINTFFAPH
jgi:DNA-binding response OmpR family regulator